VLRALFVLAAFLMAARPVHAAAFTRLQILLPGENAAPGTTTGKTGTPRAQTVGVPFSLTVRACDDTWNTVTSVSDAIQMLSSDQSATLPPAAQLVSGQRIFTVTLNAAGTFTFQAHDQTDQTIPDGASASVATLALQGFTFSTISQKNQNAGVPMSITIHAVDPQGNTVTGFSGAVRLQEITSYGIGRVSPDSVIFAGGSWSGSVTMYRADETSINRGNVNLYAFLGSAPAKNGTSDPFTVHPGSFHRVQVVVPGQTPLPGSVSGLTGSPASQAAGHAFTATVYSTDDWWNPVSSGDQVRITSSDPAFTPVSGALSGGSSALNVTLNTVGSQTLTVNDQTNGSIVGMTSASIAVIPSAADHFAFATIVSPVVAGVPVAVTVRAVDASGNTVPGYSTDALLIANTGSGSISPELITFTNGVWAGPVTFRGAGGAVRVTCSDFSSPPHTGTSNSFVVQPGAFAGLQVLLPGETAQGGTTDGKSGSPVGQSAGNLFTVTVRAVDSFWNLVPGVNDSIRLGSDDAFASMPAETALANGQILIPTRLYKSGSTRIWASDPITANITPDTSSAVTVTGGTFSRVLILAPGESPAPGTVTGRTGTATDQSINYSFNVTVLATDSWWNPVGGVTDVVHLTSGDPLAQLAPDAPMVDGRVDMSVRLATGGFQQISVSDVTSPSKTGSTTQVRAISSGFHLQATVSPASAKAGAPFTLNVKVTNDAGSVIQEIHSFVTIEVRNSNTRAPGRGTLLSTQFQLLQGQRTVSETYTFAEPIVLIAYDDAGNAPGETTPIVITPGDPSTIHLTSNPAWVGGSKHAAISAQLVDEFENGIPSQPMTFSLLSGTGSLTAVDSLTDSAGVARADFLSPRQPEFDHLHAASSGLGADLMLETAFVDPNAAGGTITNYPNPFHPPTQGTTLAWKLDDPATVTVRIFTQGGDLVRRETFGSGGTGGSTGLNTWVWDGRNGNGSVVSSGGYVVLVEAQGAGQTLNVMRRKIAVVR
jgi:hypothetical protein